ncbi:unnamed protein product [Rotaria sordida]|uniref:Uncharacterized protein n=1 Tax=Rotaria sordida TaxID=392033 RepID=A0A814J2V6_9BILA|nr:unnamed protein product [Rotaria sordida]CAF1170306.1 unnamed protein product [Rotaria sordida]
MTTQSWIQETTEQDFHFDTTNYGETQSWNEITTPEFNQSNTNIDITQTCQDFTTKEPSQQENFTTTEEITSTMTATTTASVTCPPSITREIVEETKKEIIDRILAIISNEITNKLEAIKENLLTLTSYSHQTRIEHLNQTAGLCHNHVLVAATFNGSISLAAAGPASVLTLNTIWNQPQLFGQVYWYRTNGKSFGFSPLPTIRQTSADNEDLNSPLRLSWLLDQNIGGYRAGAIRSLPDNSIWHKVIYCN